jgi:hypothetical protein
MRTRVFAFHQYQQPTRCIPHALPPHSRISRAARTSRTPVVTLPEASLSTSPRVQTSTLEFRHSVEITFVNSIITLRSSLLIFSTTSRWPVSY